MGLDKRDAKVNKEHSSEAEKQLQWTAKCYRGCIQRNKVHAGDRNITIGQSRGRFRVARGGWWW